MNGKWNFHAVVKDFIIDQEIISESQLNGEIQKSRTWGICNLDTYEYGLRAEAIVAYDRKNKKIIYWSYDMVTGIHTGEVTIKNKDVHFEFPSVLRGKDVIMHDVWEYVDDNNFNVKMYTKEAEGLKLLLEGCAKRVKEE